MKLSKSDLEDLEVILEEYVDIFEKKKKHQEAHEKEPCYRCTFTKKIIKRLRKQLK